MSGDAKAVGITLDCYETHIIVFGGFGVIASLWNFYIEKELTTIRHELYIGDEKAQWRLTMGSLGYFESLPNW